jgi:hypothetical protein
MRKRATRLVAVALSASLAVSCAVRLNSPRAQVNPAVAPPSAVTRPANEVLLTARGEPPILGKLRGIDGDDVTFLPSPYWNVAARSMKIDDIVTIHVTDQRSRVGRAAGLSFVTGFVLTGAICGVNAKYNEDYSGCLVAAGVIGGAAALVGLAVGSLVDLDHPKTYNLDRMKPEEKRAAVQRLVAR